MAVVIGPNISGNFANKDFKGIQEIVSVGVLLTSIPTLIFGLAFISVPDLFLGFMGSNFEDGANALRILAAAGILGALIGPGSIILDMCGLERSAMKIGIYSSLLALPLMLILGNLWGKEGMASAVFFVIIIKKISFHTVARSSLGMRIDALRAIGVIRHRLLDKSTARAISRDQNEN